MTEKCCFKDMKKVLSDVYNSLSEPVASGKAPDRKSKNLFF